MDHIPPPAPGAIPVNQDPWYDDQAVDVPPRRNQDRDWLDPFPASFDNESVKNTKKGNKKAVATGAQVETRFEGWTLEKAEPLLGQQSNWSRVGKRPMPFDSDKLEQMIQEHKRRSRSGVDEIYRELTSNQAGVIDRLKEQKQMSEKNVNAVWTVENIQRIGRRKTLMLPSEVRKLQVIMKRQDKRATKGATKTAKKPGKVFQDVEIIDLTEPVTVAAEKTKKKGGKKKKTGVVDDDWNQPLDDPLGFSAPPLNDDHLQARDPLPPINTNANYNEPYPPREEDLLPPLQPQVPPPPLPPPGAIPVPFSARGAAYEHPFTPNANLAPLEQFDSPIMDGMNGRDYERFPPPRAPTPRRRSSDERSGNDRMRRMDRKLDIVVDQLDALHVHGSDSSEGQAEHDSMWSPPLSAGSQTSRSSLPPDEYPRGSLHRRKSSGARREHRSRSRPRYYGDDRWTVVQPGYSYGRGDDRGRLPESQRYELRSRHYERSRPRYDHERSRSRHERSRPRPKHTYTDDYPERRLAEPRRLPAMRPQRRLTEGAYVDAEFDDEWRRRDRNERRKSLYSPHEDDILVGRPRYARRRTSEMYGYDHR